jgi:hypothetical protein
VFVAALLAVVTPAAQWLHGSQKFERHQQDLEAAALEADTQAAAAASVVDVDDYDEYDDDETDDYGDEHDDEEEDDDDVDQDVDDDYAAARDEPAQPVTAGA